LFSMAPHFPYRKQLSATLAQKQMRRNGHGARGVLHWSPGGYSKVSVGNWFNDGSQE
jgi:hypothetical protein